MPKTSKASVCYQDYSHTEFKTQQATSCWEKNLLSTSWAQDTSEPEYQQYLKTTLAL